MRYRFSPIGWPHINLFFHILCHILTLSKLIFFLISHERNNNSYTVSNNYNRIYRVNLT